VVDALRSLWRWLLAWDGLPTPGPEGARRDGPVERPWRYYWDHLPKRTAGADFSAHDYADARRRAEDVARATLGPELWDRLALQGHLDVRSKRYPGVSYRLRVGHRIEVMCAPGARSPWPYTYLCINPAYPLPELEFFAHLYLYARDREDLLVRVAAPQPWDQRLGRVF
jgi:hypothetical protein